jgi:selenocysteine-specific elongation factor
LVRALTGTDPDRLVEEQRRGLTIELGFAWCELPAGEGRPPLTAAFVDVPGHERFIATMLAGTGPAPAALLVVAADDGWSAQTEEHVEVLDLLGVPGLAVAITKIDLVPEERVAEVRAAVDRRLRGTSLASAPILAVDGPGGAGVADLARTLAERVAQRPPAEDHGRPRLWVDRVFPVRGAGTVVTGTLGGGSLRLGDRLLILPGDHAARVRGLQSLGRDVELAAPGTRVAVNLAGVDQGQVGRGDAVVGGGPWRTTTRLDAVVRALPGRTIERAGAWRVHVGSAAVTARVLPMTDRVVGAATDHARAGGDATGATGATDAIGAAGATGAVRLLLDAPLPLVAGDRLVLREAGRRTTVGGGQVADPAAGAPPRGRAARGRRVAGLRDVAAAASPAGRLRALLALEGGARDGASALAAAGLSATEPRPEGVVAVGDQAVLEVVSERWSAAVLAAAAGGSDRSASDRSTADRGALAAAATAAGAPPEVADRLPELLVTSGRLVRTPGGFATPADVAGAGDDRRARDDRLVAALDGNPFAPPDLTATARELGLDHREVNRLVQAGAIVRCGDLAFSAGAVTRAAEVLRDLQDEVGPFTAAQAKEAWRTTRRFAIPLLEHLDRTRVTRFDGRLRTLTGR